MRILLVCLLVAPGLLVGGGAVAQSSGGSLWSKLSERDHLSGDLGGMWDRLEERGVNLELVYTGEWFRNVTGGIDQGSDYRSDLSLMLELNTEKMGWWKNGDFFVHLQSQWGDNITDNFVGDKQVISNIDADDFSQLSEFWYQHTFLEDRLRVKIGKQEATADFCAPDYGAEFINSSPGFHPTIPIPSFPDQDLGIVVGITPVDWFTLDVGVHQGSPSGDRTVFNSAGDLRGPMVIVQPGFRYNIAGRAGEAHIGGWMHSKMEEFQTGERNDSTGWYMCLDQEIWAENPDDEEDEQGLAAFFQYGWADEDVSEANHYLGGGVQWIGAIPTRDDDVVGLGVFNVEFSDQAGFAEDNETIVELFYKAQVFNWLSFKPDIQYVSNPGGTTNSDALAIGLRFEVLI